MTTQENVARMRHVHREHALHERDAAVLAWLPYEQPGATVRELARLCGLHIGTVRETLKRLERAGKVARRLHSYAVEENSRAVNRWAIVRK